MGVTFKRAVKAQAYLRMALAGPSGSGKTYSALTLAVALAAGEPVAVIDTERGSASKYSDLFSFDVLELDSFHPDRYVEAIEAAQAAGYSVLVIDSITHEWRGTDGVLAQVDRITQLNKIPSIQAWAKATPMHNRFIDAMLNARMHVIVTMRSKMGVSVDKDERGKTTVSKVGMEAEQRDGIEYEFDVAGDLDRDNTLIISKSRCSALAGAVVRKPDAGLAAILTEWLRGAPPADASSEAPHDAASAPAPARASAPARKPHPHHDLDQRDQRTRDAMANLTVAAHLKSLGMVSADAQEQAIVAAFTALDKRHGTGKTTVSQLMTALANRVAKNNPEPQDDDDDASGETYWPAGEDASDSHNGHDSDHDLQAAGAFADTARPS